MVNKKFIFDDESSYTFYATYFKKFAKNNDIRLGKKFIMKFLKLNKSIKLFDLILLYRINGINEWRIELHVSLKDTI